MNKSISELNAQLESLGADKAKIEAKLQDAWNKVFDDSNALKKAISNAEQSSEYQFDRFGEIESWYRFAGLSDYTDCKEYFETWLQDNYCMRVDWDNDCFLYSQGESILIQCGTRRDDGVWLGGKIIINESEYKNEDDEIDEAKRNELIEAYMEKTGYFPGVFRTDQHGNVFHVNTQKKVA